MTEISRIADRPRRARLDAAHVVIADVDLAADFRRETWLRGYDRNQAGRGVPAEQGALRPAKDFDAIERAELGKADAGAVAIDAVDEQAHRAFQTRVVADRADAANTRDRGARFR